MLEEEVYGDNSPIWDDDFTVPQSLSLDPSRITSPLTPLTDKGDSLVATASSAVGSGLFSTEDLTPAYVLARGRKAVAAYHRALATGRTCDKRVKILLVGQDRVGKTSLGKSLRSEPFDENEPSTAGVQMIPPVKNAGIEAWRNPSHLERTTVFDHNIAATVSRELVEQPPERQSAKSLFERRSEQKRAGEGSSPGRQQAQPQETQQEHKDGNRTQDYVNNPLKEQPNIAEEKANDLPPEIRVLLKEQLKEDSFSQGDDKIWPVIWDFAGQDIYRAIHPIFVSQEDIFLLVFDLTKKLSDRAECRVNLGQGEHTVPARDSDDSNLDHLMRWMDLIHSLKTCAENEVSASEFSLPPVIVVGTHAEGPDPKTEIELIRKKFEGLSDEFTNHIVRYLPIDNTKAGKEAEQEKIVTLRKEILAVAHEMPHTKKEIPLQWHRVEKEISRLVWQGKKYLQKNQFWEEIASKFCKFDKEDDFDELLQFLHARGSIVYHQHSGEKIGLVVLDPQWLINVICEIIKVTPCDGELLSISKARKELQEKGILRRSLLDFACRKQKLDPIKDHLISVMEKFNLICKWPARKTEDSLILVPCMLTSAGEEDSTADEMTNVCPAPVYITFDETNYVPGGLFCRLVVLFGKWLSNPQHTNEYRLYASEAQFALDEGHSLHLVCYKTVIKLHISAEVNFPTQLEHFIHALSHLKEFLEILRKECHWLRSMTEKLCACCTVCLGKNPKPCIPHGKKECRHHDCAHYIPLNAKLCCKPGRPLPKEPLQPWIEALKNLESTHGPCTSAKNEKKRTGESSFSSTSASKRSKLAYAVNSGNPSQNELSKLSREIGDKWKNLARRLEFTRAEISAYCAQNEKLADRAFEMLMDWKQKKGSDASYQALYDALCHEFVGCRELAEKIC